MRPLRTLTDTTFHVRFNILHGQRNAVFTQRNLCRDRHLHFPSLQQPAVTMETASGFDLLHTFNVVPIKSWVPFVTTFEHHAPRVPSQHAEIRERLIGQLLSRRCLGLLAMSQYAMRAFERQHAGDARLTAMRAKVQVMYPTVHGITPQLKPSDGSLRLFFVGRDFMRKGMPVVTRAHARLRSQGVPVCTTIASSLNWRPQDYVAPDADYDLDSERARLNQPGIEYLDKMSNADVLRSMSEAHFTLLPTLHDTFGYSVIESLACGTPVIATNTCALPEIIEDNVSGALLPLNCDMQYGEWEGLAIRNNNSIHYNELYRATIEDLSDKLAERLLQFWEARQEFPSLRNGAANRFDQTFNPVKTRQRLEAFYERCRIWAGWFGPARGLISFSKPPWAS